MRKLLTDRKALNQVLEFFVSFCPILNPAPVGGKSKKEKDKKSELVKKALKKIKWQTLNPQIYDILETEGDCFFYIYFDDEEDVDGDSIPNIALLTSKNITDVVKDNMSNRAIAYIYKDNIIVETVNYSTGEVAEEDGGELVFIFEKGKVSKIGSKTKEVSEGMLVEEEGELVVKSIDNKDSYKDIIPIIHISSDKKEDEKLSVIPAEDYVDLCLQLMQVQSDIRATNRQMGFPRVSLLDCEYISGDGRIGGVRIAKSIKIKPKDEDDSEYLKGSIVTHQSATNESMFKEEDRIIDDLYNLVGVTNPTLMKRVGSSDSSKVMQQVNSRMETKIGKYVENIIQAFKTYFLVLFRENNVYNKKYDLDYSFELPRSIIKNSKYDDLLLDDLELKTGQSTIEDLLIRKGYTSEEIREHFNQINFEKINGKNDISTEIKPEISRTVENTNSKIDIKEE